LGFSNEANSSPVIDRRLPLEQAALAHELLGKGETVGKIVLVSE
jgi:NADPH:quinone reductase-like Zn-dependent oxidoreductase